MVSISGIVVYPGNVIAAVCTCVLQRVGRLVWMSGIPPDPGPNHLNSIYISRVSWPRIFATDVIRLDCSSAFPSYSANLMNRASLARFRVSTLSASRRLRLIACIPTHIRIYKVSASASCLESLTTNRYICTQIFNPPTKLSITTSYIFVAKELSTHKHHTQLQSFVIICTLYRGGEEYWGSS